MMIQWCVKGLHLADDNAAKSIIASRQGLQCNWWRDVHTITPAEKRDKLTPNNIDMHVNQFEDPDPVTGRPFREVTPFISLTAGTIERDAVMKTNTARRALRTALWFGSDFGRARYAYLFRCWVVVAPRRSVEVEGVAEEIRDLNVYRSYSPYQTEGEITAKIQVPANQIMHCEKWYAGGVPHLIDTYSNKSFTHPATLSNIREVI
jgi:hypothetical protein